MITSELLNKEIFHDKIFHYEKDNEGNEEPLAPETNKDLEYRLQNKK